MLYLANRLGLRVLAVHVDSGWNSEVGYKCLPEIATSAYGLLAMTNLVAGAVDGVHRNLQLPMALRERCYRRNQCTPF